MPVAGSAGGETLAFPFERGDRRAQRGRLLEAEGRHCDVVPVAQPGEVAVDLGEAEALRCAASEFSDIE